MPRPRAPRPLENNDLHRRPSPRRRRRAHGSGWTARVTTVRRLHRSGGSLGGDVHRSCRRLRCPTNDHVRQPFPAAPQTTRAASLKPRDATTNPKHDWNRTRRHTFCNHLHSSKWRDALDSKIGYVQVATTRRKPGRFVAYLRDKKILCCRGACQLKQQGRIEVGAQAVACRCLQVKCQEVEAVLRADQLLGQILSRRRF